MKKVFEVSNGAFPIIVFQAGPDCFSVHYGRQEDNRLSYGDACAKLGQALFHKLSCDSIIDNREAVVELTS